MVANGEDAFEEDTGGERSGSERARGDGRRRLFLVCVSGIGLVLGIFAPLPYVIRNGSSSKSNPCESCSGLGIGRLRPVGVGVVGGVD